MSKKIKLIKEVSTKFPEFLNTGTMFYDKKVDHILCGYFIDLQPRSCLVYGFRYPLFEKFLCLHLSYAELLGQIHFKDIDDNDLSEKVIKLIEISPSYNSEEITLSSFVKYIKSEKHLLERNTTPIILAYSMILLNRLTDAKEYLEQITKAKEKILDPIDKKDYRKVLHLIDRNDLEGARKQILEIEEEMKSVLKI